MDFGSCDMKSGIAAIISAISKIDWNKLKKGIKLYITYDEEIGFSGIKDIVKFEKNFPDTILVGEPTNNEILVGSKGLLEYEFKFKGVKVHSSNPEKGENAIIKAINFIKELEDFYNLKIKTETNEHFEIPYTTMNVGKICGGSAINSVPAQCSVLVDFRTVSIEAENEIISEIEYLKNKYNIELRQINRIPAFINESNLCQKIKTSNFITEASFLKNERIILGVGPITAHEVNEYVTEESLEKLVNQYIEIIEKRCR